MIQRNIDVAHELLRSYKIHSAKLETFDEPSDRFIMYYINVDPSKDEVKQLGA